MHIALTVIAKSFVHGCNYNTPSVISNYVFSLWLFQSESIQWGRLNNAKDKHRSAEVSLITSSVILDTLYDDNYLLILISVMDEQLYRLMVYRSTCILARLHLSQRPRWCKVHYRSCFWIGCFDPLRGGILPVVACWHTGLLTHHLAIDRSRPR